MFMLCPAITVLPLLQVHARGPWLQDRLVRGGPGEEEGGCGQWPGGRGGHKSHDDEYDDDDHNVNDDDSDDDDHNDNDDDSDDDDNEDNDAMAILLYPRLTPAQ